MGREMPEMSKETLERLSLLQDRLGHLHKLLHKYYTQNLHHLEEKAAHYGVVEVPIALQNQIKETRSKIKGLEDEIEQVECSITEIKRTVYYENNYARKNHANNMFYSRFNKNRTRRLWSVWYRDHFTSR